MCNLFLTYHTFLSYFKTLICKNPFVFEYIFFPNLHRILALQTHRTCKYIQLIVFFYIICVEFLLLAMEIIVRFFTFNSEQEVQNVRRGGGGWQGG